VVNEMRIIRN